MKFRELAKKRKKLSKAQVAAGGAPIPPFEIIHATLEPPEDLIAAIGEINMATTQILADQFDLSNDELLNGLPLIDMSKTKFWDICPLLVKQDIKCEISRFRTFTGHCNNLKHPTWGAAMTPFARYLPPIHPDGIWLPRRSIVTEVTFDMPANTELHHHTHLHHHHSHPMHEEPFDSHASGAPTVRFPVFSDQDAVDPRQTTSGPVTPKMHRNHHHYQQQPTHSFGDPHRHAPLFGGTNPHRHLLSLDVAHGETPDQLASAGSVQFPSHAPAAGPANELVEEMRSEMIADFRNELPGPGGMSASAVATIAPEMVGNLHRFGYHRPMGAASALAPSHLAQGSMNGHSPSNFAIPQPMAPPPPHPLVPESTNGLTSASSQKHHHKRPMSLDLPSARLVTSVVHRDMDIPAHDFSILFMSWGQLLDHDMTRAAQPPSCKYLPAIFINISIVNPNKCLLIANNSFNHLPHPQPKIITTTITKQPSSAAPTMANRSTSCACQFQCRQTIRFTANSTFNV